MTYTTYYEDEANKKNKYYLVYNIATYTILLPEKDFDWLRDIVEAEAVIITKGGYNGKEGCFELMFLDETETQVMLTIIIPSEQISCLSPPKENCWNGKMYIFTGGLYDCRNWFFRVYYRVADTLPCGKMVEEH
jgi:hypothetical protein